MGKLTLYIIDYSLTLGPLLSLILARRLIYYIFFRGQITPSLKIEISFFTFFLPIFIWFIIANYIDFHVNIGMTFVVLFSIISVKLFYDGYQIEKESYNK